MKTITKKIDIYNFDELDTEIQEKLISAEINAQNELFMEAFLLGDMEGKAQELLKKYFKNHATLKNVCYALDYSQGSGAMIEFDLTYCKKEISIRNRVLYYHKYSFEILDYEELTDKQFDKLEDKIIEMNEELTKFGYDCIECNISRDEAIAFLSDDQYLQDGTVFVE